MGSLSSVYSFIYPAASPFSLTRCEGAPCGKSETRNPKPEILTRHSQNQIRKRPTSVGPQRGRAGQGRNQETPMRRHEFHQLTRTEKLFNRRERKDRKERNPDKDPRKAGIQTALNARKALCCTRTKSLRKRWKLSWIVVRMNTDGKDSAANQN